MSKTPIDGPIMTAASLRRDLESIGVHGGMSLIVHSSLSAIGWVVGGAPTVVQALISAVGETGCLAMPAATPLCADPAGWTSPRLSSAQIEQVRAALPEFDRRTTPTSMGAIAETFRGWPGTLRSDHPLESVCARGPAAESVTRDHPLEFSEGPGSPFDKLHDLDSRILLLGVGFNRCTALHHAETLVETRRLTTVRFPVSSAGRRTWVEVPNVADDNDTHFPVVGERFVASGATQRGMIGRAPSLLLSMRELVAFAKNYFETELHST